MTKISAIYSMMLFFLFLNQAPLIRKVFLVVDLAATVQ